MEKLNFGQALKALKEEKRVARVGWNGKGMWLALVKSGFYDVGQFISLGELAPGIALFLPWIGMKTADDCFVPWLASQTDILAEDWTIVK